MTTPIDKLRSTGRTTAQLKALPVNGVFVSCSEGCLYYDKNLARMLHRPDIRVVPPSWVTNQRWHGLELTAVEVDHAYPALNARTFLFYNYLQHAQTRVRVPK